MALKKSSKFNDSESSPLGKQSLWERLLSFPNLSPADAVTKVAKLKEKSAKKSSRIAPSVECLWNDLSNSVTHQHHLSFCSTTNALSQAPYCHLDNDKNSPISRQSVAFCHPDDDNFRGSSQIRSKMVTDEETDANFCSPFAYDNRAMVFGDQEPVYANLDLRPAQNFPEPEIHILGNETPIYAVPELPIYANLSTGTFRSPSSVPDCVAPEYLPLPANGIPDCQAHCTCAGALASPSTKTARVHKTGFAPPESPSKPVWRGFIDASNKVSFKKSVFGKKPGTVDPVNSGKEFQKATEQVFCENCTCFLDPVELCEKYANFEICGNPELYCVNPSNQATKNKLNLRIDTKSANSEGRNVCFTDPMYDFIMNSPVVKKLREYGFTYPGEDELRRRRQLHCAIGCLVFIVIVLIVMNVVVPQIVQIQPLKHKLGFSTVQNRSLPSELIHKTRFNPAINPKFVDNEKLQILTTSKHFKPNSVVELITAPPFRVRTKITEKIDQSIPSYREFSQSATRTKQIERISSDFETTLATSLAKITNFPEIHSSENSQSTKSAVATTTESVDIIFHYSPLGGRNAPTTIGSTMTSSTTIPYSTWFPPHDPNAICKPNQFKCTAGVSSVPCLDPWKKCDGIKDCSDGSDEEFCDKLNCYGNFQCDSGACISLEKVCNGIPDCIDKKDELICDTFQCKYDYEHRCNSGYCIPKEFVCDKEADCPDHGDEYGCSKSCSPDEFMCPEGWCIPNSWVCNGIPDCAGSEDEYNCQCTVDQFSCVEGGCVDKELICDGVPNCVDGSDEWDCVTNEPTLKMRDPLNEQWLPVCADRWTSEHSERVCAQIGYRTAVEHIKMSFAESSLTSEVYRLSENLPPLHGDWTKLQFLVRKQPVSACESKKIMKVFCESYDCGIWHPSEPANQQDPKSRVKRVVGGHVSGKHQWPSMVVMVHTQQVQACSASIIAPYWVITSGRCVRNTHAMSWKIVAGNGQPNESDPEMLTRSVAEFVRHPSYKFRSAVSDFDVMLVRLKEPLDLTTGEPSPEGTKSRVGAICLPREPVNTETWCVTAGWGSTTPGGFFVNKQLRHLEMKVWTQGSCNGTDHYRGMLTRRMLCARNDYSQPCFYDEGGPLMCHDPAYGRWYLAGVMTAHSCDSLGHPAIFADVFALKDWIKNTISS